MPPAHGRPSPCTPHHGASCAEAPSDPAALAPTPSGDIAEPVCGPYGAPTHGIRYFITDLRWLGRAVFVDEGPERPLSDPASITLLL